MPTVPNTTTTVTKPGQKYEREARALRAPAPARAARATFLLEEALPIGNPEDTALLPQRRPLPSPKATSPAAARKTNGEGRRGFAARPKHDITRTNRASGASE